MPASASFLRISSSLSGLALSSAFIICWSFALIASQLRGRPLASSIPPLKNFRRGRTPAGHWMYFPATARDTVARWTPTSSATVDIGRGRRYNWPLSKKSF